MTREQIAREIDFVDSVMRSHFNDYSEETHRALQEAIKLVEQEPKTDIRECGSCKHSKDGHMAGTEECHECMWESKQEPCEDCIRKQDEIRKAYDKGIKNGLIPKETCDDAISREAVLQAVSKGCQEWRGIYGRCEEFINALPPVTPQQKIGHWIDREASGTNFYGKCSCCGQEFQVDAWYTQNMNFCPNCGAKIESEGR